MDGAALAGRRLTAFALAVAAAAMAVLASALTLGAGGFDLELMRELRAPRVLAAFGVGALLALAGQSLQVLLRNPLADPYILGTSSGATVGALLALTLGAGLWLGAAAGALASALLLLWLSRAALAGTDDASPRLILIGAMLAALFGAVATLLLAMVPDQRLRGAIFWLVGDLSGAGGGGIALAVALALALMLVRRGRSIDRMMLGSEVALLLGEPVRRLRLELVVGAALATGVAVASAGAIGFVGLVVPHALRLAGVHGTRELALLGALAGGALLCGADLAARMVAAPLELPVGAVMALIGAPLFIRFLARGAR